VACLVSDQFLHSRLLEFRLDREKILCDGGCGCGAQSFQVKVRTDVRGVFLHKLRVNHGGSGEAHMLNDPLQQKYQILDIMLEEHIRFGTHCRTRGVEALWQG